MAQLPLRDILQLRDHAGLSYRNLARDTVLVAAGVVVTGAGANAGWVREHISSMQAAIGLTVLACVAALVIAGLWMLVARITLDGRAVLASAALAVYGLIAVPATTLGSAIETGRASTGALRLAAHATMVVMLLISTVPAVGRLRINGAVLLLVGMSIPLAAGALALLNPATALAVTTWLPIRVTVSALWLLAAVMIACQALALDLSPSYRAGLGLLVVALAHSYRIGSEPAQPAALPSLTFSSVRLLGLLVALSGSYELARRAIRGIRAAQVQQQKELLVAEDGLARLDERDHELRNGIAGIALATGVLSNSAVPGSSAAGSQQAMLSAELTRLDALLSPRQDLNRYQPRAR